MHPAPAQDPEPEYQPTFPEVVIVTFLFAVVISVVIDVVVNGIYP